VFDKGPVDFGRRCKYQGATRFPVYILYSTIVDPHARRKPVAAEQAGRLLSASGDRLHTSTSTADQSQTVGLLLRGSKCSVGIQFGMHARNWVNSREMEYRQLNVPLDVRYIGNIMCP